MNTGDHTSNWCPLRWLDHFEAQSGQKFRYPLHNGHNPQYIHMVLACPYSGWCIYMPKGGSQECKTLGGPPQCVHMAWAYCSDDETWVRKITKAQPMGVCTARIIFRPRILPMIGFCERISSASHFIAQRKGSCPAFKGSTSNNFSDIF